MTLPFFVIGAPLAMLTVIIRLVHRKKIKKGADWGDTLFLFML